MGSIDDGADSAAGLGRATVPELIARLAGLEDQIRQAGGASEPAQALAESAAAVIEELHRRGQ